MESKVIFAFLGGVLIGSALTYYLDRLNRLPQEPEPEEVENEFDDIPFEEEVQEEPEGDVYISEDGSVEIYDEEFEEPTKYYIPPYEISQNTFASVTPRFEKIFLHFEGVVVDEAGAENYVFKAAGSEEEFEDCVRLLGAANIENFVKSHQKYLYIRNENEGTDYELFI